MPAWWISIHGSTIICVNTICLGLVTCDEKGQSSSAAPLHVEDASSSSSSARQEDIRHRSLASRLEQYELRRELDYLIDEESKAIQEALQ